MCKDESCDQTHCKKCGCHTIGNTLTYGDMCQDCQQHEDDLYNAYMNEQWQQKVKMVFG